MKKMVEAVAAFLPPPRYRLACNADICAGCRTCEVVCALSKEGISNPQLSRIQVQTDPLNVYVFTPTVCLQCQGPECLLACPTEALHVDAETGARVIDVAQCNGCQLCLDACPTTPKQIRYHAEKNVCVKCDLCGGDPQCVKFCPTGAVTLVEVP